MNLRTKTAAVTLFSIALAVVLLWFGLETKQRVKSVESQWIDHNDYAAATNYALARINTNFGYGGFIHHFKNYILHQSDKFPPLIEADLDETYRAIEEYRRLAQSESELEALHKLSHVVDIYRFKYEFTRKLVAEGKSPREIETHVQVNDSPALNAIAYLTQHALKDSEESKRRTDHTLSEAIGFINLGGLLIPIIALIAGLIIVFLKRIVSANTMADEAKKYAESLVQAAPEAWLIVGEKGDIVGTNTQALSLFGYTQEEMQGMGIEQLMPKQMRAMHVSMRDKFFAAPSVRPIGQARDLIAVTKDGRTFPIELSLSHTRRNGQLLALAAMRDITERRIAEQRLRLTQQVFDNTAEAILITDSEQVIADMNEAFCKLTGYSREEVLGQTPAMLSAGKHSDAFFRAFWQALDDTGHWQGEIWNRHKDGHVYPSLANISAVMDEKDFVTHFVAVYSDISGIKANEERLEVLAHFDQLTELPNRMLFHDRLRGSLTRAHRHGTYMVVMYVDLDGFKAVNDTLGHAEGDKLLVKTAACLRTSVREDDTIARLGGDEFALIFNGLDTRDPIAMLAQRVTDNLTIAVENDATPLQVTASVGIAVYPSDGETEEQLLKLADRAMYEAKNRGKSQYCFYHEIKNNLG